MAYVDTNVILAWFFEGDPNHEKAESIVRRLRGGSQQLFISSLTLVELYSVLSRRMKEYKVPPILDIIPDDRRKVQALVKLILEALNLRVEDDGLLITRTSTPPVNIYVKAIELAVDLKLRTLDLLHLAHASSLAQKGLVNSFVTLDKEILKKRNLITTRLNLKLIPEDNV